MITRIRAIHRIDPDNIGDMLCPPTRYIDFGLPVEYLDISDLRAQQDAPDALTIIGGGGLMWWLAKMQVIMATQGPKVLWGIGLNAMLQETPDSYPEWIRQAQLVGIRDYILSGPGMDLLWVPGVSCLHEAFKIRRYPPAYPIVIYEHSSAPCIQIGDYPRLRNPKTIEEILRFLSKGEVVITNRYHGVYWATLLGKKVLLWEPNCSRFFHFRYPPVICNRENWRQKIAETREYPSALPACIERNLAFAEDVRGLIQREE